MTTPSRAREMSKTKVKAIELTSLSKLEPGSFVPLYAQIAGKFAEVINKSRTRLVGAALPSEVECMEYFGVSRPTVRQAMAQLHSQRLITRGRGRGTFVAPERIDHDLSRAFEDEMRAANRTVKFTLLERTTEAPSRDVQAALELPDGEMVEAFSRLRFLEGEVFGYEVRYVPARYSSLITTEMLEKQAIISLIRNFAKSRPTSFKLTTRSIAAPPEAAEKLNIKRGTPLLSSEHTYHLSDGTPILHGIVMFRGDRYQFTIRTQIKSDDGVL